MIRYDETNISVLYSVYSNIYYLFKFKTDCDVSLEFILFSFIFIGVIIDTSADFNFSLLHLINFVDVYFA